jgi:plasmid maintenance system antidote protein VapI
MTNTDEAAALLHRRERIAAIVASAPKMTPEQADRLRRLFQSGRDPDSSGEAESPQDGADDAR